MLFMQTARAQGYWPRYGLDSSHQPSSIASLGGLYREQLERKGAVAVGWSPLLDVARPDEPP